MIQLYNFVFCCTQGDSQSPLPPNYDERIFVNRDEGELAFRPVLKADEGKYRCVAFNKAGTVNSMGELFVAGKKS